MLDLGSKLLIYTDLVPIIRKIFLVDILNLPDKNFKAQTCYE